jgi:hypothetical protein
MTRTKTYSRVSTKEIVAVAEDLGFAICPLTRIPSVRDRLQKDGYSVVVVYRKYDAVVVVVKGECHANQG